MNEIPPDKIEMNDDQINAAVQFINERIATCVYKGSIEVGSFILKSFFNDDLALACSKNSYKQVSYRKVCNHPDICVSRSTLFNMVKAAAQEQFLIPAGILVDALKYSQKVCLTRLENNEEKLALAQACIDEKLSITELKLRVQEILAQSGNLPLDPGIQMEKYLTRIERWIKRMSAPAGLTNENVINSLDPAARQDLLDAAGGILEDMSVISNSLHRLVQILIKPPAPSEIEPPASGDA